MKEVTALVSKEFVARFGKELEAMAKRAGKSAVFVTLPENGGLAQAERDRVECIFLDREIRFIEPLYKKYLDMVLAAPSLKWVHYTSSGIGQQAHIAELGGKGVILTSSTGSNAEPVAQTGLTGLLMLARGFATYIPGQHRHEWRPLRGAALPDDLRGQTLLLIGVGAVGTVF